MTTAAPDGDELLRTRGLTAQYGNFLALNQVDICVPKDTFVALIGPNGAGKTTFMDAATGFIGASGEIDLNSRSLVGLSPHRRARKGLVRTFQSVELFDDLTVRENLLIAADPSRWWSTVADAVVPRRDHRAEQSVRAAMTALEIEDLADRLPGDITLGQRKLVSIARALAANPTVLLLDEPAAGLDSRESLVLGRTLKRLIRPDLSILIIEHDMGLVLNVCDWVYVLDFGSVIAAGPPAAITADEVVIRAYLGDEATSVEASHE